MFMKCLHVTIELNLRVGQLTIENSMIMNLRVVVFEISENRSLSCTSGDRDRELEADVHETLRQRQNIDAASHGSTNAICGFRK